MTAARSPHISVGIPTCNRPQDLLRCLESLADVDYPEWNIVLVDQSDDNRAVEIARGLADRLPPLRYYRMDEKGVSRARNLIMQRAQGEILAFLDDDCSVAPTWLQSVAAVCERHPEASMVVGTVVPTLHDDTEEFIPAYQIPEDRILEGKLAFLRTGMMGAAIYLRRDLAKHGPLWDIYLGPGGRFPLADDRDYVYRVLASENKVLETPDITIVHHGARAYRGGAARRLVRNAPYSQGVMDLKLLWCGDLVALVLIAAHTISYLAMIRPLELVRKQKHARLAWPVMYLRGLVFGLQACAKVPIDRKRCLWGRPAEYRESTPSADLTVSTAS